MYLYNGKLSTSLVLISLISNVVFPYSDQAVSEINDQEVVISSFGGLPTVYGQALIKPSSPLAPKVVASQRAIVTAYSSTVDQTDDTPFITASGSRVRDGIVACNFLPFGTMVRFPDIYGDKIFVVEDRMALRNSHKMDIWFETREQAKQFGVQYLRFEILET